MNKNFIKYYLIVLIAQVAISYTQVELITEKIDSQNRLFLKIN